MVTGTGMEEQLTLFLGTRKEPCREGVARARMKNVGRAGLLTFEIIVFVAAKTVKCSGTERL